LADLGDFREAGRLQRVATCFIVAANGVVLRRRAEFFDFLSRLRAAPRRSNVFASRSSRKSRAEYTLFRGRDAREVLAFFEILSFLRAFGGAIRAAGSE
jgi:hypothetical protein